MPDVDDLSSASLDRVRARAMEHLLVIAALQPHPPSIHKEDAMRRLLSLLAALMILVALPGAASAAGGQCSIEVTPSSGGPTDIYRVTASNVPVAPSGGSVEVRIDLHRLGTREGSIYFLFLVPGTTEFYLDLNQPVPGEPAEPMTPGRYLVLAETPHLPGGCHATDRFVVA